MGWITTMTVQEFVVRGGTIFEGRVTPRASEVVSHLVGLNVRVFVGSESFSRFLNGSDAACYELIFVYVNKGGLWQGEVVCKSDIEWSGVGSLGECEDYEDSETDEIRNCLMGYGRNMS